MTERPAHPDSGADTGDGAPEASDLGSASSPPGTPRWVKIFGIVGLVLVLLIVVVIKTGMGGEHGPGRHTPPGDTSSSSTTETTPFDDSLAGIDRPQVAATALE